MDVASGDNAVAAFIQSDEPSQIGGPRLEGRSGLRLCAHVFWRKWKTDEDAFSGSCNIERVFDRFANSQHLDSTDISRLI